MQYKTHRGQQSRLARLFVRDTSSTNGAAGLGGLAYNTAGLVCYYCAEGATGSTAVPLVTATLGTWSSGGFVPVDAVNMPGTYEFGVPNAALAGAGQSVTFVFRGATNMAPTLLEFELDAVDYQDAVRHGATALPAAAAGAVGGLPLSTTSSGQVQIDMAETISPSASGLTMGRAALAAIAEGVGVWKYNKGTGTLAEYTEDGSTLLRSFTLTIDNTGTVTQRT